MVCIINLADEAPFAVVAADAGAAITVNRLKKLAFLVVDVPGPKVSGSTRWSVGGDGGCGGFVGKTGELGRGQLGRVANARNDAVVDIVAIFGEVAASGNVGRL